MAYVLVRGCIRAGLARVAGTLALWRAEAQRTGDAEPISLGGLLQNALASCFANAFPRTAGVRSAARYVALELLQPIADAVNADRSAVVVENWLRRSATGI